MNKFEYTFVNSERDEKVYTDLLNKIFQEERGYTLHDNEEIYSGFHSTLVCKYDGIIIGGICAYIADEKRPGKLPMERRGIELKKHIDLKNMRYAEICRAGVFNEFRKYNIYRELLKRCLNFCIKIGSQAAFWVAKKHHSKYYEDELALLGYKTKYLSLIKYTHTRKGLNPVELEYYLSGLFLDTQPTRLDVPTTSQVVVKPI